MTAASPTLPGVLTGLVRDRGPGLLGDRRRLLGLLRDRLPGDVRAIRILMMAFDSGVPSRLSGTEPSGLDIGREGGLLAAETGLGPEIARQAVETWAMALCNYVPAAAGTTGASAAAAGPRPQVRKLPPRPSAMAVVAAPASSGAAAPRSAWRRRWPAVVLGLVVLLGGIARLVHQPAPGPVPEQPATPPKPATPPPEAQPGAPTTPETPPKPGTQPPEAQPATPGAPAAPGAPAGTTTPEGYALISGDTPYPVLTTERINQSPNTIGVWFGMKVGSDPVSYYVAFAFDKGERHGQGLIGAIKNGQKIGSGVVSADRIVVATTGRGYLRVGAPMQENAQHLPGLCAFLEVADTLDRIDLASGGLLAIFGLDKDGRCDMENRIGSGTLK